MHVAVLGLGRFGSFWAHHLSRQLKVTAWSRTAGREAGDRVRLVGLAELFEADVVWLCPAISALPEVLREIAPYVRPGQVIADTCSVKLQPSRQMLELLPAHAKLLATHPMFGPDSARGGVEGLPLVLHNLRGAEAELAWWKAHFAAQGMRVLELTPDEHDQAAAYTQGVTHLIGRVLSDMGLKDHAIATQGYKRLLDLIQQTCNDPFQLFLDMQHSNPYTSAMREDLKLSLERTLERLDTTGGGR
ncbi:MAG: prephenate dehydrogenase/arogenate dehydrogenase family protein [Spirochaetales bacterium]